MQTIRRAILLALLVLGMLAFTGCGNSGARKVTLRYWNGFTGPDGRTMLRLVKRFNEANPDVYVLMQRMDWATYYNKLFVAGMGHRAPEVFVLQTHAIERFAQSHFVRTVDDLVSSPNGLAISDIDANIWDSVAVRGRHYGVPLDIWPMGMYYNRRLFREAGIVDARGEPQPPRTRQEFLDAARRLTRDTNGDGMPDQWGFVFTNFQSNVYTVMKQFGGEMFTPDNARSLLNSPQNVAALQLCVDLIGKYKVAPPPENFDAWIGFRQGKVGMAFEGIYMLADLQKQQDLDFAGAPVPVLGDRPATWAGSHNLCLRADLKGPQLQAAWRFIKFLSDNSLDWAAGGQVPVRKSLRNTPRFQSMAVQAQFARQIPYARYMPKMTFAFEFQTEFNNAVEKALRGSATPQQALDVATANLNRIIARQRALQMAGGRTQ
ncbi:MAG TPA: ABC transporter substrate-binding protein [Chthonomonadaceae bacterium]|nr:ABC transporter substrate-binding protein [Chthonomonadaceae bacterium]